MLIRYESGFLDYQPDLFCWGFLLGSFVEKFCRYVFFCIYAALTFFWGVEFAHAQSNRLGFPYKVAERNELAAMGAEIVEVGVMSKGGICWGCHGKDYRGTHHGPALLGRSEEYIYRKLRSAKYTKKDWFHEDLEMPMVLLRMNDRDMRAISIYMGILTEYAKKGGVSAE